ncbi:Male sterility protein [Popillia japonica]|uniref:Male sterility protein n=1 Tax=Popillia japonica TaxID=7064 RepID=A0AAW1K1K3_POPJA
MSERDQDIFFCDLKRLDWDDYFKDHFLGVRQYILKDPPSTLSEALKKYNRLYWLHQTTKLVISLTVMRMFWSIISFMILFISGA